jgi:predicted  nucleic acid-binding Zn-ribbon protein
VVFVLQRDYNGLQTRLKQAEDRNASLKAAMDEMNREKSQVCSRLNPPSHVVCRYLVMVRAVLSAMSVCVQLKSLLEMEKRRMSDKETDMRRLRTELERKAAQLEPLQEKVSNPLFHSCVDVAMWTFHLFICVLLT